MKLYLHTSALMVIVAALLAACAGAPTPDTTALDLILTEGVQTMVAAHFATQTAQVTPASPTPSITATRPATNTPFASGTPTPTQPFYTATLGTPLTPSVTGTLFTPTPDPNSLAYGCNNLAFIVHVNYPPGTDFKANQDFKKTWKVANTGSCNWMYQYALVLVGGDALGGKTTKLGKVVTVGDWAELSVLMTSPKTAGTYTSYWRLSDVDGHLFGATLTVSITVNPPTKTPQPTAIPSNTPTDTPVPTDTQGP